MHSMAASTVQKMHHPNISQLCACCSMHNACLHMASIRTQCIMHAYTWPAYARSGWLGSDCTKCRARLAAAAAAATAGCHARQCAVALPKGTRRDTPQQTDPHLAKQHSSRAGGCCPLCEAMLPSSVQQDALSSHKQPASTPGVCPAKPQGCECSASPLSQCSVWRLAALSALFNSQ